MRELFLAEEEKIYLEIKEYHLLTPKPMNDSQISNSRKKLARFIEIDTNRTKLIEKKNKISLKRKSLRKNLIEIIIKIGLQQINQIEILNRIIKNQIMMNKNLMKI